MGGDSGNRPLGGREAVERRRGSVVGKYKIEPF
jgi:hypothetical protein